MRGSDLAVKLPAALIGRHRVHGDVGAGVVELPLGVPQRGFVLWLRGGRGVPCENNDLVLTLVKINLDPPMPLGPRYKVVQQLGRLPGHSTVQRDVDARDRPLAAGEVVTADLQRPRGDPGTVGRRHHVEI